MGKRIFRVLDKDLFLESSIKEYPLLKDGGVSILRGNTKDGKQRLHAFVFSNDWPEQKILDWMSAQKQTFENVIVLPDEAATEWISEYEAACLNGDSSWAASEKAWLSVNNHWHRNLDGKWVKLEENWLTAIMGLDKPVEIFRCGCYPQFESEDNPEGRFTTEHADKCISNFEDLGYHRPAAITLDHVDSGPALGWVEHIFRVGERIYAEVKLTSTLLVEKLKSKEYVHRSVEMWADYFDNQQNKYIGPVLDRLTFLGVKKPQVKGMTVPTFNESKDKLQPHPLMAFSVDSPEINQSMRQFLKSKTNPSQLNPTNKGVLMELDEKQLEAKLEVAKAQGFKEAEIMLGNKIAKFEGDQKAAREKLEIDTSKLDDRIKKLEEREAAFEKREANAKAAQEDADLTAAATKLFTELGKDGKVVAENQSAFIMQYKLAARSSEKAKLSDGKEGTALDLFIESQKKMPNLVKMGELTAKIEANNQTDSREIAGATEASKEVDAKVVAYCEANKLDSKKSSDYEKAYAAVTKAGK